MLRTIAQGMQVTGGVTISRSSVIAMTTGTATIGMIMVTEMPISIMDVVMETMANMEIMADMEIAATMETTADMAIIRIMDITINKLAI